jgi:galactokinase
MSPNAMNETVPVTNSLDAIYSHSEITQQEKRHALLRHRYAELYGKEPEFVARSPGRVNIIGEHIDYSLYEVLPMAVATDVLIAVATHEASGPVKVSIANVNAKRFPPREFEFPANGDIHIDASTHEWTNYFKAGLQGALSLMRSQNSSIAPRSMVVLVDGNVPAGGGLSSSAAFVCASALAAFHANDPHTVTKKELVELAMVSERAVGVNSGGMDQAASVLSTRGNALSVSFSPELHAEPIAFPETDPPITFMIAQSFVAADKHVTGPVCYNLRVVECTLAAVFMAAHLRLKLPDDSAPLGQSLHGLQDVYFSSGQISAAEPSLNEIDKLTKMVQLVETVLIDETGYTREAIAEALNISVSELEQRYMTKFPIRASKFLLRQRALHVFSEAMRVLHFKSVLQKQTLDRKDEDIFKELGSLMNQTQYSCREIYDCSCPEIDELCSIARAAGAYGSRLTGAGWGGCTVHLVPQDRVDTIRKAWETQYYRTKFPDLTDAKLAEAVVVSEPEQGSVM